MAGAGGGGSDDRDGKPDSLAGAPTELPAKLVAPWTGGFAPWEPRWRTYDRGLGKNPAMGGPPRAAPGMGKLGEAFFSPVTWARASGNAGRPENKKALANKGFSEFLGGNGGIRTLDAGFARMLP